MTEIANNKSTVVIQMDDWQGMTCLNPYDSIYVDPNATFYEKILDNRSGLERFIYC